MAKIIALFNHKGGVSKTTTTQNLGWVLAEAGHRVLMVDADPQCNLTGTVLGLDNRSNFEDLYERDGRNNLHAALDPAFSGSPDRIEPAEVVALVPDGLFLLPGHLDLSFYEAQLAVAFKTSVAMPALQNLPGAIGALLRRTAEENDIDVVLVDMSPSIGALNQSIFLTSDFFIVPTSPDYFCQMAIGSLSRTIPKWCSEAATFRTDALSYPLPANGPKFLGIISQKYRPRSGQPARSFQHWIDRIKVATSSILLPELEKLGMTVSAAEFTAAEPGDTPFNLANISDFNSLIAKSHEHNVPAFALSDEQLDVGGRVLTKMRESRENFRRVFEKLGTTIAKLIGL